MFLHVFFVWIFFGVSILAASNNKRFDGLRHNLDSSCFVPFIKKGKSDKKDREKENKFKSNSLHFLDMAKLKESLEKNVLTQESELSEDISPLTVSSFGSRFQSPFIFSNTPTKESIKRLQEAAEREEIQSNDKKIKKRSHSRKENTDEIQNPSIEEQNLKKARKDL